MSSRKYERLYSKMAESVLTFPSLDYFPFDFSVGGNIRVISLLVLFFASHT